MILVLLPWVDLVGWVDSTNFTKRACNVKANNYKFLVSRPSQEKNTIWAGGYYLLFCYKILSYQEYTLGHINV